MKMKVDTVRLNAHGLKTTDFEWMQRCFKNIPGNSFDFATHIHHLPESLNLYTA
jgi:hypothetical protein